jgi:hypothetical protein
VVYPNWGSPDSGDLTRKEVTNPAPESELTLGAGFSRFCSLDEDLFHPTRASGSQAEAGDRIDLDCDDPGRRLKAPRWMANRCLLNKLRPDRVRIAVEKGKLFSLFNEETA